MKQYFYECKTEEQKQELRDEMLEHMYYQTLAARKEVADIKRCVERMEQKLVYVGATEEERKFLNVDGTLKYDAINESCDRVLALFGDKYVAENSAVKKAEVKDNASVNGD